MIQFLGHCGFTCLGPNCVDLFFYLFDLFKVAATLMVRDLCFQLGDLLGILPAKSSKIVCMRWG